MKKLQPGLDGIESGHWVHAVALLDKIIGVGILPWQRFCEEWQGMEKERISVDCAMLLKIELGYASSIRN